MSRQNSSRAGWIIVPVLVFASAAPAPAAEAEATSTPEGRVAPGFERISVPATRAARPAGDGFIRLGGPSPRLSHPPSPRSRPAARTPGRAVSVERARPGLSSAPDMPAVSAVPPSGRAGVPPTPPTPEGVENYRRRLEARLLEKYNNTPEWAGRVAGVTVVLSKPLETSVDGTMIRADFDQLVHDAWGKRIPDLEREYFVVTFGSDGVRQVRSDPSIRVGLDLEKAYSERAPLAGDPFRGAAAADTESFRPAVSPTAGPVSPAAGPAGQGGMPGWWRPEHPEP